MSRVYRRFSGVCSSRFYRVMPGFPRIWDGAGFTGVFQNGLGWIFPSQTGFYMGSGALGFHHKDFEIYCSFLGVSPEVGFCKSFRACQLQLGLQ